MVAHGAVPPGTADLPRLHRRRRAATLRRWYFRRIIFGLNTNRRGRPYSAADLPPPGGSPVRPCSPLNAV